MEKVQFNNTNLREFIVSNTVFKHLNEEELDQTLLEGSANIYKRGNVIYEEGSKINGFVYH